MILAVTHVWWRWALAVPVALVLGWCWRVLPAWGERAARKWLMKRATRRIERLR